MWKESYTLSRSQAADFLNVSTRSIDRYVKSGKLSYKKIANKVLLNKDEVMALKKDYDMLHQNQSAVVTDVVNHGTSSIGWMSDTERLSEIDQMIDQKIERFFLVFKEKEKLIEDKNKIIFMLQQRVGELESKIQSMIALPDYNEEKQKAVLEKKKLEQKINELNKNLWIEKTKNLISLGFLLVIIGLVIVFFWITQ